jgi:hypothetical protein
MGSIPMPYAMSTPRGRDLDLMHRENQEPAVPEASCSELRQPR